MMEPCWVMDSVETASGITYYINVKYWIYIVHFEFRFLKILSNISRIAKDLNEIDKSMMSKIKKNNSKKTPKSFCTI